ncbi:MAG: efflux RND transporter permease subunit [Bacillota bacterium]
MNLLKFIVQRKILVGLLCLFVILVGSYAVFDLDKELMPVIEMDGAYIEVNAGELAASEVERSITTPLEQKLQGHDGIEEILSTTTVGRGSLHLTFEQGKGEEIYKEVESIVNSAATENPAIKDIESGQFGSNQSYEFFMDVSGGDMATITTFAKDILEPRLEGLAEVRDVSLTGLVEHEITIEFDRDKLTKNGLDSNQVISAIQQANDESTLGELAEENGSPLLRWNTKLENVEDLKTIRIPTHSGFIELQDVAKVSFSPVENPSFVWKNGSRELIFVQIGRVSDVTQIEMAEAIRTEVQKIRDEGLIDGFQLTEMVAQADYVQDSIDGVTGNILIGAVLAIVILLLFLRNVRATLIVGISIPTSVLLTFTTMWLFGYSLNILTLIGLGLGIGMMVDSSIVILESIYRKKEQGLTKLDAVLQGVKEVASAVIASMLTTVVVFLPVGMLGGEMGQFMIVLSIVVAITLISSVIISFTLIPSLSEKFLKLPSKKKVRKEGAIIRGYTATIDWAVKKKRHSLAVITIFIIILAGSFMLVTKIPMTIMPDVFNRYAELMVDLETGITLEEKETVVQEITNTLSNIKDIESSYVMDNGGMFYTIINMTKGDDITREQKEINEEIFKSLRALEESHPIESVQSAMTGGGGYPVQVNIKGEHFEDLQTLSAEFIEDLKEIEGIVGVNSSMDRTSTEQMISLKEQEIEKAGLTQNHIRQIIEQAFLNMPVGEMNVDGESVPLAVKWTETTDTKASLLDLKVPTADGEKTLSTFIELNTVDSPNEISHIDGERYISISADIEGRDLGAINRDVQKAIDAFDTPAGYSTGVAGDLEQQQELIKEMIFILGIAIFLVYLVMAVQFNHLLHPIIVMSVIPMTIVGVILGLFLTQRELSLMSGMGIVMLIGIVLNNAILLVDRTNQLRREGKGIETALVQAGKDRIRPIFMTTLTTAGGMLPLAFASGTSGNYQAPMATAIISGLLFATLITLLLIPAVYRLFTRKEAMITDTQKIDPSIDIQPTPSPTNH